MINSISNSNYQYNPYSTTETKLTDDQKSTLQSIIANYDPENMTDENMKSMMDEIKEAGITPSKEFGEIMNTAGFKKPEKPEGEPPMGPPPATTSQDSKTSQLISEFLAKKDSGEITEDDLANLIKTLNKTGQSTQGLIVDKLS